MTLYQNLIAFFIVGFFMVQTTAHARYKAIVFDVDGVLVDTEQLKYESWRDALKERDIDFSVEEYYPLVGHSSKRILGEINSLKRVHLGKRIVERKNQIYHAKQKYGVALMVPGVRFLKRAIELRKGNVVKVGLASSASLQEILENVKQMGLSESDFDCIISGKDSLKHINDSEGVNKPKPYIYELAAQKLEVDPKECIVFEDKRGR